MLDSSGIDKLQQMHGHLREVSSATELATHGILDGLGRAVSLVEKLDEEPALCDVERHRMISSLREELGGVMNHLQFQDITAQQLKHIESQLVDMNRRITQVVKIFAPPAVTFAKPQDAGPTLEMNMVPDPEAGQAVADEIFAVKARKTA
jgi:chemotaxis regulatin CheY-phosphate phosphatase CheZ